MTRPKKSLSGVLAITLLAVAGCGEEKAPEPAVKAPAPAAPQNLFERLGGEAGIGEVVDALVVNIGGDGRVNSYFNNFDQRRFKTNMTAFICEKTGGPCSYTGGELKSVHKSLQVTAEDFDAMIEVTGKTLDQKSVAEGDKKELLDLMASYKPDIVAGSGR